MRSIICQLLTWQSDHKHFHFFRVSFLKCTELFAIFKLNQWHKFVSSTNMCWFVHKPYFMRWNQTLRSNYINMSDDKMFRYVMKSRNIEAPHGTWIFFWSDGTLQHENVSNIIILKQPQSLWMHVEDLVAAKTFCAQIFRNGSQAKAEHI